MQRHFSRRFGNNPSKDQVQRMRQLFQENRVHDTAITKETTTSSVAAAARIWETLWAEGVTPWDLEGPTPALISELHKQLQRNNGKRFGTAVLIPGCGSGYDVLSLARYFDRSNIKDKSSMHRTINGLEISETSLQKAKKVLDQSMNQEGHFDFSQVRLWHGDFFDKPSTWKLFHETAGKHTITPTLDEDQTFDFIFDYTFFCALSPGQRTDWGQRMQRLLSRPVAASNQKSGQLLTLMFPYVKEPRRDSPGPPYPVSFQDYGDALRGSDLAPQTRLRPSSSSPFESQDTVPSRVGQEMVAWWSY